ncbi:MAG: hypothetical protein LBN92_05590, partial [Treponema sp.]|nr:hypothetical protein [Treponema sp.]
WKADIDDDKSSVGRFSSMLNGGHIDVLCQRPDFFRKDLQLELRAGAGGGERYTDHDDDMEGKIPLLLNFGFSLQYFIWKNWYAEAGIDFQYMTVVKNARIYPAIGMGWQFGRWAERKEVDRMLERGEDPSVPVTGIPENELTLSMGWSPVIRLSDYTTTRTHWNEYGHYYEERKRSELERFNPAGAYLRAAYLPYRWGANKLGVEFSFFILDFPVRRTFDKNRALGLLRGAQFDVLYQRKLREEWQLNVRLGPGFGNPYLDETDVAFTFNTGFSVQRFFWRGLYAEAGLDLVASVYNRTRWVLNPAIGIGWQFNRDAETGLRLK